MTPEEARLNLDATTLRPQDTEPEARELAAQDHALGEWVQSRRAFDEEAAEAMAQLPVPSDLKAMILNLQPAPGDAPEELVEGESAPVAKKGLRRLDTLLSILAATALLTVAAVALWNQRQGTLPGWQEETLAMVRQIDAGSTRLDHFSHDLGVLKGLLGEKHHPMPVSLPSGVSALTSLGCKTFAINGREATIVCFEIAPNTEAHLVVVNNQGLDGAPPQRQPQFVERDGWNIARWSDGAQCYLIATRAPKAALRNLFALLALPAKL